MKWPFVRRSVYEELEAKWIRELSSAAVSEGRTSALIAQHSAQSQRDFASAERLLVAAEARYADLMTSYRQLRLQGYADPASIPPVAVVAEDPIEQAVMRASKGMPSVTRAEMLARAREEAKTQPVEIVVQRIQQGHRPMDEFA